MNDYQTPISVCRQAIVHTASMMGLDFKIDDIVAIDTEYGIFVWLTKFNPQQRLDDKLQPVYDKHGDPVIDYQHTMWAEYVDSMKQCEMSSGGHNMNIIMPDVRIVVICPQLVTRINKDGSVTKME